MNKKLYLIAPVILLLGTLLAFQAGAKNEDAKLKEACKNAVLENNTIMNDPSKHWISLTQYLFMYAFNVPTAKEMSLQLASGKTIEDLLPVNIGMYMKPEYIQEVQVTATDNEQKVYDIKVVMDPEKSGLKGYFLATVGVEQGKYFVKKYGLPGHRHTLGRKSNAELFTIQFDQ